MNTEKSHAEYIAERKATEDRYKARAAENMFDHRYTQIATGPVEAWRCKDPRSTFHAFDILITRFGISVVGDIENMSFVVGSYYGMEFLAKDDVQYYIHSKLDPKCKEFEFDQDRWRELVVKGACSRITEISSEDEAEKWPEWVNNTDLQSREIYAEVMAFVDSMREHEVDLSWTNLYDMMQEAEDIEYTEAAMIFVQESGDDLHMAEVDSESVEKVRESVYGNLYMINHAAKAIMAMKALGTAIEQAPVEVAQ
jgi:hypothetical protein